MGKIINLFTGMGERKMEVLEKIEVLDANAVAKSFLSIDSMTPKKLQKLCYYAQAWYLTLYDRPLFNDEFEAWIHGPVCNSVYQKYRQYGWQQIEKESRVPEIVIQTEGVFDHIKQIYRIYGEMDGDQLERLTHTERPWQDARTGLKPNEPSTNPIGSNAMRQFYLEEFENSQND